MDERKIPVAVRNEFFYLFARLCMIFVTVIGVPFGTWMLSRVIAKADEISAQVSELRNFTGIVSYRLERDSKELSDHEIRIRGLERK